MTRWPQIALALVGLIWVVGLAVSLVMLVLGIAVAWGWILYDATELLQGIAAWVSTFPG